MAPLTPLAIRRSGFSVFISRSPRGSLQSELLTAAPGLEPVAAELVRAGRRPSPRRGTLFPPEGRDRDGSLTNFRRLGSHPSNAGRGGRPTEGGSDSVIKETRR